MSDTVALAGIIVLGLVLGVVAVVGIVFGVPVRSKVSRSGVEIAVEPIPPSVAQTQERP